MGIRKKILKEKEEGKNEDIASKNMAKHKQLKK